MSTKSATLVSELLRALFAELEADPVALERLRSLLGAQVDREPTASAPAYTVQSLAEELGRTPRSIRGAIERGELDAVKRGRGYVISAEAVSRWASASTEAAPRPSRRPRPRPTKTQAAAGPMRRALAAGVAPKIATA
jgi:excisionase family DNA binding protein